MSVARGVVRTWRSVGPVRPSRLVRLAWRRADTRPDRSELIEELRDRIHVVRALDLATARWPEVSAAAFETPTNEELRDRLRELLGLDEAQSRAVMDLQLRRASVLERAKIASHLRHLEDELARLLGDADEP